LSFLNLTNSAVSGCSAAIRYGLIHPGWEPAVIEQTYG